MGYIQGGVYHYTTDGDELHPLLDDGMTIRIIPEDRRGIYARGVYLPTDFDPERDVLWAVDIEEAREGDGTAPNYDKQVISAVRRDVNQANKLGMDTGTVVYVFETTSPKRSLRTNVGEELKTFRRMREFFRATALD